jgi:hypothetical protein
LQNPAIALAFPAKQNWLLIDDETETAIFAMLVKTQPKTTLISIRQSDTRAAFHPDRAQMLAGRRENESDARGAAPPQDMALFAGAGRNAMGEKVGNSAFLFLLCFT